MLGRISTNWDWDLGRGFRLAVTIPPNAMARVRLPAELGRHAELVSGNARSEPTIDAGDLELSVELSAGRHALPLTL